MNKNDHNSAKVGHIKSNYGCAIYCYQNYRPAFGDGHDLFQDSDSKWKNFSGFCSYSKVDMPQSYMSGSYNSFDVEDYEVFQVIKK
ncbi:hypothetical protein RhiirA4_550429 [Rhizophagus irregularis]|uniref:TLDc domain-containing protein n=1 Tax=Rhizophagus irregularis TaxID=588596 RepID=A0A2I1HL91_9GLOM|nr:hypothetical protein RhiirA4_550429 [Rhizophagus irregularis]